MCTHWYIYGLLFLEKIYIPIKKINKYKINKLEYYRDELNEYSPLINAKILDKDIYDQDVIVAMLLYIDEKKLDKNSTELLKHEKEFIDKEKFIFHDIRNRQNTLLYENTTLKEYIEDLIEDDMRDLKLVESEYYSNHAQKTDILTVLFFFINIFCLCKLIQYPNDVLNNIFIFEIIINLTWMIIYSINTSLNLTFKMNLTEKGIIYLSKLNGSKKFLNSLLQVLRDEAGVEGGSIDYKNYKLTFGKKDSIKLGNYMYKDNPELFLLRKKEKFTF